MNRIDKYTRAASAVLLLAAGLALAPAVTFGAEAPTRTVKISDLYLASPQGQKILERRVRAAIEQVCTRGAIASTFRDEKLKTEQCREAARADVQRQLEKLGLPAQLVANR